MFVVIQMSVNDAFVARNKSMGKSNLFWRQQKKRLLREMVVILVTKCHMFPLSLLFHLSRDTLASEKEDWNRKLEMCSVQELTPN